MNKVLYVIIGACALIASVAWILTFTTFAKPAMYSLMYSAIRLGGLVGLYQIASNGTTFRTNMRVWIFFFLGVTVLASVLKVMHLTGANELLSLGLAGVAATYFICFFRKETKGQLDILKAVWVVAFAVVTWLTQLHIIRPEWSNATAFLLWILIFDFLYLEWQAGFPEL
jgi:hypothetical protein